MNNRLIKTFSFLVVLALAFSVSLCVYSALGTHSMSHHDHVLDINDHMVMAQSFGKFVVPLGIVLDLLFVLIFIFNLNLFFDIPLKTDWVYQRSCEKVKKRLDRSKFNPRSPPLY